MNKFILLSLAAVALAGCSNESFMDQSITEKTNEMKFSVYANSSNAATKGASIDNVKALAVNGGFSLSAWVGENAVKSTAYFSDLKITSENKVNPVWKAKHQMYWPTKKSLFFSAIYPNTLFKTPAEGNVKDVTNNGAGTTFTYTTPASYNVSEPTPSTIDNSAQADIMYAMNHGSTTDGAINTGVSKPKDGAVALNFNHALTQIAFKAAVLSENIQVTINSIEMHNVNTVGTFSTIKPTPTTTLPENTAWKCYWTIQPNPKAFLAYLPKDGTVISYSSTAAEATPLNPGDNNNLMLIPQELKKWDLTTVISPAVSFSGAYLKIACKLETITPTTLIHDGFIYVPFSSENTAQDTEVWLAGNRVTYTLNFGGGYDEDGNPILTPMTYNVTVEEWKNVDGFNDTAKPTI